METSHTLSGLAIRREFELPAKVPAVAPTSKGVRQRSVLRLLWRALPAPRNHAIWTRTLQRRADRGALRDWM